MKDLTVMTDSELVKYHEEMWEAESIEYKMDGSGECGHFIAKAFAPIWEAFEEEFNKRNIDFGEYHEEMPY